MIRLRLEGLARLAWLIACLPAAGFAAGLCPDAAELDLLRNLNREAQYPLAVLQGDLLLRRAEALSHAGVSAPCVPPPGILLETGKALYHLGEFARVREMFRPRLADSDPAYRRHAFESHFLELRRPDLADSALALLDGPPVRQALRPGEGGLYGSAAHYLRGRLPEARAAWPPDARPAAAPAAPAAGAAAAAEGEDPRRYLDLGYKQPWLGAAASAIPGAGYLYAGETADGLTAMLAVAVLYGAAVFYGIHDAPARAGIAAALGGIFHLSSFYGGYRAAGEANQRRRRAFLKALHPYLP